MVNLYYKISHIGICSLLLAVAAFALFCLISLITVDYPAHEALVYEECTFVKYEKKVSATSKGTSSRYYIFVEEYDKGLEIDNIVFTEQQEEILQTILTGDKIKVSIYENKKQFDLFSMVYQEKTVLSYEDYLSAHNRNNTAGIIGCAFCEVCTGALFIGEILRYKRTGKTL